MTCPPQDISSFTLPTIFSAKFVSHTGTNVFPATKWKRIGKLGEGGHGSVYFEKEATTGKLRAVKKLLIEDFEARGLDAQKKLRHLIAVIDCMKLFVAFSGWYEDDAEEFLYIAMEYVPHGDLGNYIKAHGPCDENEAKELTRQLLDGLIILHERYICHWNLKPQNVLIASFSPIHIKLADFGISKSTLGTNLRTQMGMKGFLAPEQQGFAPKATPPKTNIQLQ